MSPSESAGVWPGLNYGATERLLAEMQETTSEAIRTRFRKLRVRPFPDEIRSGTGVHVQYDLSRLLALAGVFELNRLLLPQGRAAEMVQAVWPEWCRACIAAAVDIGIVGAPSAMPADQAARLMVRPDAYSDGGEGGLAIAMCDGREVPLASLNATAIFIDATRTVSAIVAAAGEDAVGALARSFETLERSFGWTPPVLPHRSSITDQPAGTRGFLDEGPFFARAEALLRAPESAFEAGARPLARERLGWLLSYVEQPAPVDVWKTEIGDDEHGSRLKHFINEWALERGLRVSAAFPRQKAVQSGSDPGSAALRLIVRAREGR